MWSLHLLAAILFSYITIFNHDAAAEANTFNCTLPPYPIQGSYLVLEPETKNPNPYPQPGHKLKSYSLIWGCSVGYGLLGFRTLRCFEDGSTDTGGANVECVPYCKVESNNVVVMCGIEEHRCIPFALEEKETQASLKNDIAEPASSLEEYIGCGRDDRTDKYISGGRVAELEDLPWHAAIYAKTTKPYMQICGGSIVTRTVIISAAHCFWSEVEKQLPASDYAVAVGKLYRPWNDQHDKYAQKSDVADVKIPLYFHGSATNLQDDIALVIAATPFKLGADYKVEPVCLNFDVEKDKLELSPGNNGKVGGWGLTSEDGPASPILKVVNMPVIDIKQCFEQSDPTFKAHITGDKICAGHQNGTAVCKGDSGGGLSFREDSRPYRYYLRGVVSGAPRSDHLCNTYAWASFTHIQRHEAFIRETIPPANIVASQ